MSDGTSKNITATFETREAADLAVEHLVQKHGLDRADISIHAGGELNSSSVSASGGDTPSSNDNGGRDDGHYDREIEVSADVSIDRVAALHRLFGDIGAIHVSSH